MSENRKNDGKLNNMDPCFLSVRLSVLVNFCLFQLFSKNVDLSDLYNILSILSINLFYLFFLILEYKAKTTQITMSIRFKIHS
jgi:hypothetical protein